MIRCMIGVGGGRERGALVGHGAAAEMEEVLWLFRDIAHGSLREVDHLAFIVADPRAFRTVLGGERAQPFAAAVLHSHAQLRQSRWRESMCAH